MNDKTAEQLRAFRRNPSIWVSEAKEIMSNAIGNGIVMEGSNMLWRVVSAELESGFGSSANAPSALCELTAVFGVGDRKLHVSIDDLKRAVCLGPPSSSENTRADSGEAVACLDYTHPGVPVVTWFKPMNPGKHEVFTHQRATSVDALPETCQWSEDEDGNWDTSCGEIFVLTADTPDENGMKFCCYCGEELVQHRFDLTIHDSEDAAIASREGDGS